MKLFATLILSTMAAASLVAASIPRCDLNGAGKSGNVKLNPGTVDGGMRVARQTWGPEETRQFRLVAVAAKPVGPEWTLCKFTFTPETSGSVSLAVGGQWAKTPEARGWLAVSKLSVNGTPVSNADLKKVSDRNGKQIPNGFWVYGKTVYVADGGPDGAAAMLVNHDSRLTRVIKVEGGQPVTVEYMAKAVETPAN